MPVTLPEGEGYSLLGKAEEGFSCFIDRQGTFSETKEDDLEIICQGKRTIIKQAIQLYITDGEVRVI